MPDPQRIRHLEQTLTNFDIEVTQAIHRGQQSTIQKEQEEAALLRRHLEQITADLGAETIVQLQETPDLANESDEVLDALEVILEAEHLTTIERLVTAWRFLCRPEPTTH